MKTYKVDLDYESFLFNPHYEENSSASLKIIREFEYVFFLINQEDCELKNIHSYDESYLKQLKNLGFKIPSFNPTAPDYSFWWGSHVNIPLEKKLNSKITSAELAKENNWGFFTGALVSSLDEVKNHLEKYKNVTKWIIKRPHSFSGIGHYYFEVKNVNWETIQKIVTEKVLLEPVYNRVFDIGTTFEVQSGKIQRQFMVENFNSTTGGFKGGAGSSNLDNFKKYIQEKYQYSLDELEKITKKIANKYLEMGATSNIQIDSFVYEENGELKLYPLVEVNYRKTMGLVIQSLADKNEKAHHVEWKVLSQKEISNELNSWIKLSPEGTFFRSFYKTF